MKQPKSKKKNSKRSHHDQKVTMGGVYRDSMMTMARVQNAKNFRKMAMQKRLKQVKNSFSALMGAIMASQRKSSAQNQ